MRDDEELIRTLDPQEKIPRHWLEKHQLTFEEVNQDAKAITELAYYLRKVNNHPLILLPFDHTLEAEAFGASVHYDSTYGSHMQTPLYTGSTDIQGINLEAKRLLSTVQAVHNLKATPYNICFNITGPATVIDMLISPELFFNGLKKLEKLTVLLETVEKGLITWIDLILSCEPALISYGDPTGDATIVGPTFFKAMFGRSNLRLLKAIESNLRASGTIFHIHPALAKSLLASDLMAIEKTWTPKLNFPESILEIKDNEGLFVSRLNEHELVELVFNDEEMTFEG